MPFLLPAGPGEAECQAALAAATDEARQLEAALAAAAAEAEELEAAIAAEREEAEALRAQLGSLEGQTAAAGERVEANVRFLSTAQWADEVASTITLLGGLSLLHVSPGALHLKLVTAYPAGPARGADPGPCATADHELSLHLAPGGGEGACERGWRQESVLSACTGLPTAAASRCCAVAEPGCWFDA